MSHFVIHGGQPLRGEVTPAGNKNAALPILAACLMCPGPVELGNIPDIGDVRTMRDILTSLGVRIDTDGDVWRVNAAEARLTDPDPALCRRIRASILLAGPALARHGRLTLPPPGGDVIGRRRLDTHLLALSALGARTDYDPAARRLHFRSERLRGADLLLDEASVTATENAVMAATLAEGRTTIRHAASEPHVQDLCHFLNTLGARIGGIGTNTLVIDGVSELGGGRFTIGPDYLETVSFVGAAAVTGGEIRIRRAGVEHLAMIRLVFRRLGVEWRVEGEDLVVPERQRLTVEPDLGEALPQVCVAPWPAFPSDLMSIAIVAASQTRGGVLFHDWMYPSRMFFTDKLVAMGAQITLCDPHRCIVQGPAPLTGERLESPDIRAGMALLLAALAARGRSEIHNVAQIDRGYANIETKLRDLGASIERVS